jgi:hypothetical protein
MDLKEIIENLRNGGTREEQDKRDAARYRYLRSKEGADFDVTVDDRMTKDGYIDLPRAPKVPELPPGMTYIRMVRPTEISFERLPPTEIPFKTYDFGPRGESVPVGTQKCGLCGGVIPCGCPAEILPVSYPDHL